MLHLRGADAEGQRPQGAIGGGVRVTTDDGHAGQRSAFLRPDDVDDAVTRVADPEVRDLPLVDIVFERIQLHARDGIADDGLVVGRNIVIEHRQVGIQAPGFAAGQLQTLEGLRRGDFVDQVAIDVKQGGPVVVSANDVGVPEFVVQRAWC